MTATKPKPQSVRFWLYWAHLFSLFGIALANLFLGLGLLTLGTDRGGRFWQPRFRLLHLLLGGYTVLLLLSVAGSYEPAQSARALGEIFSVGSVVVAVDVLHGRRQAQLLCGAIVLLASLQSLVGLVQYQLWGGADLGRRIHGTVSHYMTFSGILLVAVLVLLAWIALSQLRGWPLGAAWLAVLAISLALFYSLTRSAWVGLLAGVLVLLALLPRRRLVAALAALVFISALLLPSSVWGRAATIVDLSDPANYDRLCMAYAGWHMLLERPILGQGPGMVEERYPIYRHPSAPRSAVPHLHNAYLQLAAERGLPALLVFLALLGSGFWRAIRKVREEGHRGPGAALYAGAAAALAGLAVAGLFEDNWGDTEVQRLALFLLALCFAADEDGARAAGEPGGEVQPGSTEDGEVAAR